MKKFLDNNLIQIIITCVLIVSFIISSFLFVLTKSNIFPITNFFIALLSLFIKNGKYRIHFISFFAPFFKCFNLINSRFTSSFFTVVLIIYELVIGVEYIVKKENIRIYDYRMSLIFVSYVFVISIANMSGFNSILQCISSIAYFILPFIFLLDFRVLKNNKIIYAFSFGILFANAFSFFFLYILKSKGVSFLEIFMPSYINAYTNYSGTFFRFGGLRGDPNGNCLYILLASTLLLTMIKKNKQGIVSGLLTICMQPFAIIGGSKSYYIGVAIVTLGYLIYRFHTLKYFPLIILGTVFVGFIVLLIGYDLFYPVVRRILMTDLRQGILSGLTTERYDIFRNYFNNLMNNPFKLLLGHGSRSEFLANKDFHNTFIQIIWDYGIIGIILFVATYFNFFKNAIDNDKLIYLNLIVLVFYAFSLHMLHQEGIYFVFICLVTIQKANRQYRNLKCLLININNS